MSGNNNENGSVGSQASGDLKELKNEMKLFNDVITRSGTITDSQAPEIELRNAIKDALDYLLTTVHMKKNSERVNELIGLLEEMKSGGGNEEDVNFMNLDYYIDALNLILSRQVEIIQ